MPMIYKNMDNFKNFILSEMPISKFQLMGQWGPEAKRKYGYSAKDTGILENPKAVEKIHKHWSNSKNNFDLYFLRSYAGMKHVEVGEVKPSWVLKNLGVSIEPKEDTITVIFTNNTGAEKIHMTAWAMAHRLGHAIRRDDVFENYFRKEINKDFEEILKYAYGLDINNRDFYYQNDYFSKYEKYMKAIFLAVGKMKSVRENILRNSNEFIYELVAQYIITGKITFNDLPKSLILSRQFVYGRPNHRTKNYTDEIAFNEYNEMLHNNALKYENYLDTVFNGLEGKIFVM
jgi:hypothetical protein